MGVATAIVAGAVIGAGAGMYGADRASKASEEAAGMMSESAAAAAEVQMQWLRENEANIAAAVDQGIIDLETGFNAAIRELMPMASLDELNTAKQLIADPESLMKRPSTQHQFKTGVEAMQAGFSRTGGGGVSGPALAAATEYGQNFASLQLDRELARLQPLIDIGVGARTNIANIQQSRGASLANLRLGGATGKANIGAAVIPGIARMTQQQGGYAAGNVINQANIQGSLVGGISSNISDMLALYATRPELFSGGNAAASTIRGGQGGGYGW